jgi:1-acyl-sn-glycerol-3-phosphate acyltransferase
MAKVSIWQNRKPLWWFAKYYFSAMKPETDAIRELQLREEALEGSNEPADAEALKKLYAEEKQKIGESFYGLCEGVVKTLGMDMHITGTENIPAGDDPFCVIANHQGYMDVIAIGYMLGGRQISFIAKQELKKAPLIGKYVAGIRGIFIPPAQENPRAHVAVINEGVDYLKKGFNMAIFPEGTRSWGPQFYEGGFHKGSIQLALRAGVPIVPVALEGAYHCYEENKLAGPGRVDVRILPAIPTAGIPKREWGEFSDRVIETVKDGVRGLQAELGIVVPEASPAAEAEENSETEA